MKDKVILILTTVILVLLLFIVIGDFAIVIEENRTVDDSIINLLQVTITGLIGISIGTYFGMKSNNKNK